VEDKANECRHHLFVDRFLAVFSKLSSATAIHGVSVELFSCLTCVLAVFKENAQNLEFRACSQLRVIYVVLSLI